MALLIELAIVSTWIAAGLVALAIRSRRAGTGWEWSPAAVLFGPLFWTIDVDRDRAGAPVPTA